jgi:hypothetical protein
MGTRRRTWTAAGLKARSLWAWLSLAYMQEGHARSGGASTCNMIQNQHIGHREALERYIRFASNS